MEIQRKFFEEIISESETFNRNLVRNFNFRKVTVLCSKAMATFMTPILEALILKKLEA